MFLVDSTETQVNSDLRLDFIYMYKSGHLIMKDFNHILGFSKKFTTQVDPVTEDDLFCTSDIATILGLDSSFSEFNNRIWQGMRIIRENYISVMQVFRLTLADWNIPDSAIEALYDRLMINQSDENARKIFMEKCKRAIAKKLRSMEKFYA